MSETIGDRIKRIRQAKEMSQTELAKVAKYSDKSAISKLEHAGNDVTMKQIKRVAQALGVPSAYLMGWDDNITQVEFENTYQKYGDNSRLAFYLDALSKLPDNAKEEVFSYIDYQKTKNPTEKKA